jgi:subtilisin-like proprotein convertase family protein
MRSRILKWFVPGLLVVAGAWLFWHSKNPPVEKAVQQLASATAHPASTAPAAPAGATTAATNANQTGAAETNRFAYRLANTTKSIGELVNDRKAVLLENALIDTGRPLNFSIPKQLQAQGDPGAYIVQARGPISAAFRALLARAGAGIVAYIPNDAYLVRVSGAGANLLAAQPPVQSVIRYEPYYKISSTMSVTVQPRSSSAAFLETNRAAGPSLLACAVKQMPLPAGTCLTLGLFSDGAAATEAQIEKLGARIIGRDKSPFGPVLRVQPPADWVALAALPGVQIVEPYRPRVHANDLSRATMGVAADTQVPTNYFGLSGSNVIVAVADSGIDTNHPDFSGSGTLRVIFNDPADGVDTDGHGTHVAGTIAGDGTESTTVTNAQGSIMPATNGQFRGMAPLATLFSVNLNNSDQRLQESAAQAGALIQNDSWNYGGDNAYDLAAASYDAATRDAQAGVVGSQPMLFVFSAGNGGQLNRDNGGGGGGSDDGTGGNADTIFSPATAKDVITVGALEQLRNITNIVTDANSNQSAFWQPETDSSSQVAAFSSRGNVGIGTEGQFGRYKPDVVAPGVFVISTRSTEWISNGYYNPTNDAVTTLSDLLKPNSQTDPPLQFFVFNNAIEVDINAAPGSDAPNVPLPISVWEGTDPYTAAPNPTGTNSITIYSPLSPVNTIWQCVVTNTTANNLSYTLSVDVKSTNNYGNYYGVLSNLNDSIGPWYRYESGTSMAAAGVSGTLALMEDYFINTLQITPSPALLKALLINGARPTGSYNFQVENPINYEGWGQVGLPNSLPVGMTNQMNAACASFFVDQSPTNALATGDSHSYLVTLDTNADDYAQYLPLQITLAWTDPPGDPAAALKLVNNLTLVVSNMDTGDTYFGNDIPAGSVYNNVWDTNSLSLTNASDLEDSINNVQQVILPPLLAGSYTVTVMGREVNVNAVTAQTNSVVQDYALVIACGEGEVPTAITMTDNGIISNPTNDQDITFVMTTNNSPLMNQIVGASSPLLGTNQTSVGTNTIWTTNGLITFGMTNQWHFYVVTNPVSNPPDFTNAAFITFSSDTLSIPREGVFANSETNATRPEADIDLYVAGPNDPNAGALTNLDPGVIANCVNGMNGDTVSLGRGGTEFVIYTNSKPGDVYYIGVKSEDRMAAEYDFIPIFTDIPFGQLNGNGDQVINGLNVPVPIPNGSPAHPQSAYVFAIAPMEMQIERVVVTNTIAHQNFGNLVGVLSHNYNGAGQTGVTLNQHDEPAGPPPPGPYTMVYDDSGQRDFPGSQTSDGPGSLNNFVGQEALGVWILTETDNALTQTGSVQRLTLLIQPHIPLTSGVTNTIPPLSWSYNYIDVPPGYTNLTVFGTNLPATSVPPLQMYLNVTNPPTFSNYLFEADLMNCASGVYPSGVNPGNSISYGPPLQPARYWVGVYNPDPANSHEVYLLATLGGLLSPVPPTDFSDTGPSLPSDAVASDTIVISNTDLIASVNVGIVVAHPRISDLTFTLVSPSGQSVLLMENRGGDDTNGAGSTFVYTNVLNTTARGYGNPQTNYLAVPIAGITVPIIYNFYTAPDEMTVYAGDDPTTFDPVLVNPVFLLDTGFTNNPWIGPGPQDTRPETISVNVPPGYTNITIIMNQFGNPAGPNGTAWTYTAGAQVTNFEYLMFTEDTNLATLPIKYAVPPFSFAEVASNYTLSDFELATNGNYVGPTNIYDAFGGWFLPTNRPVGTNLMMWSNNIVSVVTDPRDSIGDNVGTNFLALGDGTITRSIPTIPGREYSVTFWYRGPGIAGWWRGEGNADDSSQPEGGNNGLLIGRFDFPAGEVGQAFEFEDAGQAMEFAGTNTYVQIRQSSALDVGAGGGLTVEGWINPTNLSQQMPLVEWLAKVPVFTNSADTNFSIVAGPFLNPATGHYYYMLAATNWTTSEIWATNLGGHLVTIDTANEQNWVYDTFANYDATNRNLWIGLTNSYDGTTFTFGCSSGLTNVLYANWANGQPTNSCGTANYTLMLGSTNAPGLWTLANNNEVDCSGVIYSNIFGVVEVDNLQTNGVQFWISVTNTPGTNNAILDGAGNLYTNGCLYANLMDVSNVTHEIYSAAGLIQSNIYQHVALTYDTNSGVAMLYYNGTNVATTNMGVFVPKTGGDVLLGKDMSLVTNGYYGGEMDEMSIYSRALSGAEIAAIYNASVFSTNGFGNTNGLVGKFDPSVTPAYGLAEARVAFGATTNIIYGVNNQWELNSFTFTATSNAMPLQISGLEPGILLDDFAVSEMPLTNLYYLPEQSLDELAGNSPFGTWTLQIWDNRANAAVTAAAAQLINWELQFVLETNVLATALPMNPENPTTITVPPGQTVYLSVAVPSWAGFATNVLDSATGPVNLLFNPTNEPTGLNPGDQTLLTASIGGIGSVLAVNSPLPLTAANQAGQSYYLGVRNSGTHAVTAVVEADFDITGLSNSVPVCGVLNTNDQERYFSYDVSSNAFEATFQLLDLSSNADLVVRKGSPLPTLFSSDYGSFNPTNADENIYVFTNSQPVPLSAGRWYLGVFKRDAGPVYYTILAKELDKTNGVPGYAVIDLTNRVPFNFTAGPGAALTNFFRFNVANTVFLVTNAVSGVTTNVLGSIHFELYNLSGNGDLTVQTDAPPFAPPFLESSQEPSRDPELITIRTNGVLTNLVAQWYLGVPNHETNLITYTIIAELDTNIVFPAFPGAEGAGADAVGGRFGNVYHVTCLADSGPGSLRDAVSVPNRTIVFDLSGTIGLLSPLVITNSFLTIAGQTAPGGGIAVAGNMTTVQSAHDVVIRYVRFRSVTTASGPAVVWFNGFEGGPGTSYGASAGTYFAGGRYVIGPGYVDVLANGYNGSSAYEGNYDIDLNGASPSGISTNIATIAGTTYTLSFAYTRNPDSISHGITPQMGVVVNGNPLAIVTANQVNSWANLGWQTASYVFTANSPSTQLAFISTNTPGVSGVLLDAVGLTANLSNVEAIPLSLNTFEGTTAADYTNGLVVANSGWKVLTNQVSLVTDPTNAYGGSNFLALANGVISNTLPTVVGNTYSFTFAYRGPGIVSLWRGESNANDSIDGNNGLVTTGSVQYAAAEVGQGFRFDGNANRITVPDAPNQNFGPGADFSIEGWVGPLMPPPTPTSDIMVVVDKRYTPNSSVCQGYEFDVRGGTLFFHMSDSIAASGDAWWSAGPDLRDGKMHHVAVTLHRNSTTGGHMYVDGAQIMQFNPTTVPGDLTPSPAQPFRIGNHSDPGYSSYFHGMIDELSLYKRALTASEIKAICQNGAADKVDSAVFSNSPALSLAEAQVRVNGQTSTTILGNNTNWQTETIIFTATQNGTPVQISGIEPGMLLDASSIVAYADDALRLTNASDVVADHISTSWSTNNLVSVLGSTNVTVQWSIMADSLTNNLHGYGSRLRYGNGALTFHHNLYADNYNASPRLGDNLQLDFVNNIVYNWGLNAGFSTNETLLDDPRGFTNELNYVGNYLIAGSNSVMTNIAFWSGTTNTWIYQTNNFMDSNTNGILDGADTGWFMFTNHYTPFQTPFPPLAVGIDEAYQAYERVLDFAGPAMDKRDAADTNIVSKVRTQTGALVSSAGTLPALNSTPPYLDTDQDGIPDFWEITFGTDPFTPSNNNLASDGSGYTDLEEYDNWLAGPHALTVTNTPAGVDLMQLFGKTGNLSFSVTNAVNGSVYLTNVLNYTNVLGVVSAVTNTGTFSNSFAIFTPTNDFGGGTNYGYASFDVYVTNNETIAYFGPVTVSVVVSKIPVAINSNFPPVIINLTNGISYSNANAGGSDFYHYSNYTVPPVAGVLFEVTNASGPVTLVARYGLPLPSLPSYDYISANPGIADEHILVLTNSTPVFLTNGDWYLAVVNISGGPVTYSVIATNLSSVLAPLFVFPTNSTVTNIVETFPFTVSCLATDLNTPPLPLTFALVSGPTNMTVAAGGLISWTPTPAQSPSANLVSVSVSNGALTTTNTFKIFVSPIPSITQVSVTATNVVLQWSAPTNDIFEVDWTTSLTPVVNWSPFTPPVTSTDGTFTFTDTNLPLLIKFYRLRLLP